jgi:hypothetical protein
MNRSRGNNEIRLRPPIKLARLSVREKTFLTWPEEKAREAVNMTPKFVVGQPVDYNKKFPWMSDGPYEVVSVLPVDGDDAPTYRVKCPAEPFARAAKEMDLVAVAVDAAQVGEPKPIRWADLLTQPSRPIRSR